MDEQRQKSRSRKARPEASAAEVSEQAKEKRVEYLTAQQLAEVLQVSESTVHRLRRAGRIPAVMLTDRLIRFNLREVQKALRPVLSARAQSDGDQAGEEGEPSPQLSFEDVYSDFSN